MSYTIEELSPAKEIFTLDGAEHVLSLYTLQKSIEVSALYGSLEKAFEAVNKQGPQIVRLLWVLLEDKAVFGNNFALFFNSCYSAKEPIVDWAGRASLCVNNSITKSMPVIKNQKRYKELQEITGAQTDTAPCYARYFDQVAKRYGYSLEQFTGLTLRQLHILLNTIGDESYKDLEVQAALQGKQLKPRTKFEDITEEQDSDNETQALEALKRLQAEYEAKNKDK